MVSLDACIGIAILGRLTAPQYPVEKPLYKWKGLVASLDMLAITLVPLHQVGLVAHFGKMSTGKTGTTTHKKKDYLDVISMRP